MTPEFIKSVNSQIMGFDLKLSRLNLKKPNFSLLLHEIVTQVNSSPQIIESLYKSVADTTDKENDE